jgi:predicted ATPase/class 3 adenylate cyclase
VSEAIAERKPLPSGTVTFLFTDIEGSTERWERHRAEMQNAVRRHEEIMRAAIAAHDGYVFKTVGDAFCATFRTAPEAIAAALDAQRALSAEDFSAVEGLKVRMAIHTGLSYERSGDYFGPTVNRVSRLLSIGHGGQVLISGTTADLAQGEMPPKTTFRDLGSQRLKDLAQPEQVYQLVAPELAQDFPPLRSLDALPNNLPLQITSFVGRDAEIAALKDRLAHTRLLTLVGSGGVGKTRLALQVGADVLDQYEDGVWLVEFAPLSDADLTPSVLAGVLGVTEVANRSLVDSIVYWLKLKRALLILDNCEHVLEAAAKLVDSILRGCPNVRVVVASRQALGIDGETVHRVASLAVPEQIDGLTARDALEYESIALFVERASAAVEDFKLTDANAKTVAHICRRLDGIALALELAAPRLKALTIDQLSDNLNERFRLLTGGKRTSLQRQQTMRALIDWSYDLLSETEKTLLRRVAIFGGGWTLEAAREVCADEHIESWDVVDLLTSLVDKSLVVAELQGTSPRYRLLESTREYALEKLEVSVERQAMARKHAEFFLRMAERADRVLGTMPRQTWLAPLELETENFRGALTWAIAERHDILLGCRLTGALEGMWLEAGLEAEGYKWIGAALAAGETIPEACTARLYLALAIVQGYEGGVAYPAAQKAVALYERLGDQRGLAQARLALTNALVRMGRSSESKEPLQQALETFRELGDAWGIARCLDRQLLRYIDFSDTDANRKVTDPDQVEAARKVGAEALSFYQARGDDAGCDRVLANLAELEFSAGNPERAVQYAEEALAIDMRLKRKSNLAISYNNLAAYRTALDQLDRARQDARAGVRAAREAQSSPMVAVGIQHLALIGGLRGQSERAAQLLGYVNAMYRNIGNHREPTEAQSYERLMKVLGEQLNDAQLERLLAQGESMIEEQAIEEAMRV